MTRCPLAWIDGEVRDVDTITVSAFDRTLLYGLGAFETMRLHGGRPFLLERHLARLQSSLHALGLPMPPAVDALPDGLVALAAQTGWTSAMCRITVTSGPEPEGPTSTADMHVIAALRRPPPPRGDRRVEVGVVPFAHDVRSPIVGVKSTSYLVHYLLRDQARAAGREDDLMIDGAGHVTEASVSNVFVVSGGVLRTPPLSEGILAGVTRGVVLELAADAGIEAHQSPLEVGELGSVDECFLTGAGKCVLPVDVLDGHELPRERPVSEAIAAGLRRRIAQVCDVEASAVEF